MRSFRLRRHWVCQIVVVLLGASGAGAALQADAGSVANARTLYESANYDEALGVLNTLDRAGLTNDESQTIRLYTALCLVALNRAAEAERPIEEMVRADPSAALDADLPPRFDALLTRVRARVMPSIVRERYERGRDLFQRKDYSGAVTSLTSVIALIDNPGFHLSADQAFSDLRVLADGFLQLAQTSVAATDAAARDSRPAVQAPPSSSNTATIVPAVSEPRASGSGTGTATAGPVSTPVNAIELIRPRPIAQAVPPFPRSISAELVLSREGEIELQIRPDGSVQSARTVTSIHPAFDQLLIETALRSWKYQPATRGGVPIPFTVRVHIVLESRR